MYRGQRPDIKDVIKLSLSMLHNNYKELPNRHMCVNDREGAYLPSKLKFNENLAKTAALQREQYKAAHMVKECDKRILQSIRGPLNSPNCSSSATIEKICRDVYGSNAQLVQSLDELDDNIFVSVKRQRILELNPVQRASILRTQKAKPIVGKFQYRACNYLKSIAGVK